MRTSFHHQPEAQHPNFQLSTSWQADYPIHWGMSGPDTDIVELALMTRRSRSSNGLEPAGPSCRG